MGPSALRITNLHERLAALGHEVYDLGNIEVAIPEACDVGEPRQRYAEPIARTCRQLADRTRACAAAGAVPLVLGGDHSVAMGSIGGVAAEHRSHERPIGVIWVDAHGDINTPDTSPSGNVHGMPLAALLGAGPEILTTIAGSPPVIQAQCTVLFGIHDLDRREKELVRASGVRAITMEEIDRRGIAAAAEEALAVATRETGGVYISLDMDGIDPQVAPGVGTPVQGGLTYRESHLLMETVAASGTPGGHGHRRDQSLPGPCQRHRETGSGAGAVGVWAAHPLSALRPDRPAVVRR